MNLASIGFLILGAIIGLLALISVLSALKGTPVRGVKAFPAGEVPRVHEPAFRDTMELLSHAPLAYAHEVEIFTNGDQTYPRLWEDLKSARETITIQLYYCEPGKMADTFRDILLDRARDGVRIH